MNTIGFNNSIRSLVREVNTTDFGSSIGNKRTGSHTNSAKYSCSSNCCFISIFFSR